MASTNWSEENQRIQLRLQVRLLQKKIEILDQMIRFQDDVIEYLRYEIRTGQPPPINMSEQDLKNIADDYAAKERLVDQALDKYIANNPSSS